MNKFPSIESLRHVIRKISDTGAYHNWDTLPTITFEGTCKLHGTSAGVNRKPDGTLQAQSRENEISYEQDNAGFAAFVQTQTEAFHKLFATHFNPADNVTIFGEWCGKGIQKNMGINQLEKHFVVFAVLVITESNPEGSWVDKIVLSKIQDNAHGIWNIYQIPTYTVTIDFNHPDDIVEKLTELTLQVEDVCPWATFRGVKEGSTLGEGIVFTSVSGNPSNMTYVFKSKGLKHKGAGKGHSKAEIAPEKLENIQALVTKVLPEWRLEQGVSYLKEHNIKIIPENTGQYIKWVSQDILKEEADVLAANGLEWKAIVGAVNKVAKEYFFKEVDGQ